MERFVGVLIEHFGGAFPTVIPTTGYGRLSR